VCGGTCDRILVTCDSYGSRAAWHLDATKKRGQAGWLRFKLQFPIVLPVPGIGGMGERGKEGGGCRTTLRFEFSPGRLTLRGMTILALMEGSTGSRTLG